MPRLFRGLLERVKEQTDGSRLLENEHGLSTVAANRRGFLRRFKLRQHCM